MSGGAPFFHVQRLVKTPAHRIEEQLQLTQVHLGIYFPQEYLVGSSVYCFIEQSGVMFGGLFVRKMIPFRTIDSIPEASQMTARKVLQNVQETVEVNGVWIDPTNKSPFVSFSFWLQMISILLDTEYKQFIFTVDHNNKHMASHVDSMDHEVLYSGRTRMLDGMKNPSNESIILVQRNCLEVVQEMLERRGVGQASSGELMMMKRIEERRKRRKENKTLAAG